MKTARICRWALRMSAVLLLAFVLACGPRHPLGIPDDQWQMMSLEEQNTARVQQAELDRAAAEERAARARLKAAEAEARKAELEAMRRNAPYGDRVQCVFEGGQAYLNRNWHPVSAFGLDLIRGYEEEFTMEVASGRYSRMPILGYALYDGQTITLCRLPREDTYRHEDCLRLVGTRRELQQGLDSFVSASEFLRGRLRCDLPPSGELRQIVIP
ncbi:hypothetical protein [Desulfonatronum lacustre]|uniref:hypothetical protein n=1 Tax=Desulfonatronum lacustre TaxID=66849 RepID=UPI00048BA663|nr:hypothetical protein [Desulfonatronum lacustre]